MVRRKKNLPKSVDLPLGSTELVFYWEWLRHEDDLVAHRTSAFLILQGLLLAAYSSLKTTEFADRSLFVAVIAIGIGNILWWIWVGLAQRNILSLIRSRLLQNDVYKEVWSQHERRFPVVGVIFAVILLLGFSGFWTLALLSEFEAFLACSGV